MNKEKRIVLVGYPPEYYLPFGEALEQVGFQVYWIVSLNADERYLVKNNVRASRVLNVQRGFVYAADKLAECREILAKIEDSNLPRIYDIIMMDRLLRLKSTDFALVFLGHVVRTVEDFLVRNEVELITSFRDTAIQLTVMLIAKQRGIPFVVPTRLRIPQDVYGFCATHNTDSFITLREMGEQDLNWAEEFYARFLQQGVSPALKKSTRDLIDVLKLMPSHARAFAYELRRSLYDIGNDYTRYPIGRLVRMYFTRRLNLIRYKISSPCVATINEDRYFLYALHTQPESSIDVQGSYFSDQISLVRTIARSIPASHSLYVKVHPTDVDGKNRAYYNALKEIAGIKLIDYSISSKELAKSAEAVFALTGTIAYEAALFGRPVITFARNFFNVLPTVYYCTDPIALPVLIEKVMAENKCRTVNRELLVEIIARLRSYCVDGEVARVFGATHNPLGQQDLVQLQATYTMLYDVIRSKDFRGI